MSTRSGVRAAHRAHARARFLLVLALVLGVLLLGGAALAAVSLAQGPRISQVQVDPAEAVETSGTRLILTANQPLLPIDIAQVQIEPAAPFTVDAAGRDIGIRFTVPLDAETTYSVVVSGVMGRGAGGESELRTTFTTPSAPLFLLQRSDQGDTIFHTDLTGEQAVPVFRHPRISDFRATSRQLVVVVDEDSGSRIIVMDRDGGAPRDLVLPGEGNVSALQVSDRGGLVGYTYSDRQLTATSGRPSLLVTQSMRGGDAPRIVQIAGADAAVHDWRFIPDSSALLFIDFDDALSLEDPVGDAGVQSLGLGARILGISRGTYTAFVQRATGEIVQRDLRDGAESSLPATVPASGPPVALIPFPGGTLRHVVLRDAQGLPTAQQVLRVDEQGVAVPLTAVSGTDAIMQVCVSPSGQHAAVVVAPDMPRNAYDGRRLPLPETLRTRIVDVRSGAEGATLDGFDASWCALPPQR